MVNKYHMAHAELRLQDEANIARASGVTGIKFTSGQQIADYNEAERERKKKKRIK